VRLLHCQHCVGQASAINGRSFDEFNVSSALPRTTRSRWLLIRSSSMAMTFLRWGNRPAFLWIAENLGAALQADGETRSVDAASSIRRRSAG
jgi:hypothetical protein